MEIYQQIDVIPLSFSRVRNNALVSGLTVTVVVKSAKTGTVLLASTSVPELGVSGIYTYNWTHGLTADTECIAVYTVGTLIYTEYFLVSNYTGSRAT